MDNKNNEILPPKRAAEFIGLSTSTLAKMRLRGDGPIFIKTGRCVFYSRCDLLSWLDARKFRNTSEYLKGTKNDYK